MRIESRDQDVDRLRSDSLDDRGNVIRFARAGCVEAIRPRVGVGGEARERGAERVRLPNEESFAAPGQDNGAPDATIA